MALSALSLAVLATPLASAAGADPSSATPAQKKEAMDHFTAGKQAFEAKNYEKAAMELRASLEVVDSPNARLELARALRDGGKLDEAWAEYERVVQDATKLAAKEERYAKTADAATTERTDVEAKLAFVLVAVAHPPAGAVLKVGGKTVSQDQWDEPIVAPAGAVDVVLTDATGKELARQTVMATVGQKLPVDLDAQPAPAPAPVAPHEVAAEDKPDNGPPPQDTTPPPSSSGRAKLRPWAYVAGGVGVAGLATFGIFGLMSNSNYSDLQGACPNHACPSSKSSEIDNGKTFQTVANVGLVVGIVGVAAGATLFVLSLGGKSAPATTGLVVGPSFVGLRGTL